MSFISICVRNTRSFQKVQLPKIAILHFSQSARNSTRNDMKGKKIDNLLGDLDGTTVESTLPTPVQKKLVTGLDTKKKRPMDAYEIGMLETRSAEILDILSDALESKLVYGIFKDMPDTAKVVSINHVKCNRDMTQITAVWHSDLFLDFIHQATLKHGERDGKALESKIFKKTSALLQAKESKFRTYLMRHMSFRRVPRITFLPPGNELSRDQKYDIQMDQWQKDEALRLKMKRRWERDHGFAPEDDSSGAERNVVVGDSANVEPDNDNVSGKKGDSGNDSDRSESESDSDSDSDDEIDYESDNYTEESDDYSDDDDDDDDADDERSQ